MSFSENAVKAAGITQPQQQAPLAIKNFPGREQITVGELSERLQIKHHSTVGLVNRPEAEKLIIRSSAEDDRRKVFISLTGRGLAILRRLSHREELQRNTLELRLLLKRINKLSEAGD